LKKRSAAEGGAPEEARRLDDQDREGAQKAGRLCESAEGFRMAAIGTAGK
jgi:hypothetical protein